MKVDEISLKSGVPLYSGKENKRSERKAYDPSPLCMRSTYTTKLEECRERVKELPRGTGFSHYYTSQVTPDLPRQSLLYH